MLFHHGNITHIFNKYILQLFNWTYAYATGGGHGDPLQYPCLENPMDREVWRAIVHRVTKSWTRLK